MMRTYLIGTVLLVLSQAILAQENPTTYVMSADQINAIVFEHPIEAVYYPDSSLLKQGLLQQDHDFDLDLNYAPNHQGLLIYPRGKAGTWQLLCVLGNHQLSSIHVVSQHGLQGQILQFQQHAAHDRIMDAHDRSLLHLMQLLIHGPLPRTWVRTTMAPKTMAQVHIQNHMQWHHIQGDWRVLEQWDVCSIAHKDLWLREQTTEKASDRLAVAVSHHHLKPGHCARIWAVCKK